MRSVLLILSAGLMVSCSGNHWRDTSFPERAFSLNGEAFKYRIYVPNGRDPKKKIPVMLFLHGSGMRGDDNHEQLGGIGELVHEYPQNFPYVMVFPQCPQGTFWTSKQIEKAIAELDRTVAETNGDVNRLFIAGYSMGGFGVWHTAITHPEKFAAMISIAGGVEELGVVSPDDRSSLSTEVIKAEESGNVYRAYSQVLKDMSIWIVHGDQDESVPVEQSRKLYAALRSANAKDTNYFELPYTGHAILDRTFLDERLVEWLNQKAK